MHKHRKNFVFDCFKTVHSLNQNHYFYKNAESILYQTDAI